jgi:hypothetical protein
MEGSADDEDEVDDEEEDDDEETDGDEDGDEDDDVVVGSAGLSVADGLGGVSDEAGVGTS